MTTGEPNVIDRGTKTGESNIDVSYVFRSQFGRLLRHNFNRHYSTNRLDFISEQFNKLTNQASKHINFLIQAWKEKILDLALH